MWTGDNLPVLRGLNSASVDLIYLDPPFNSNKTYSAPIGSKAAGAAFKDTWTLDDVDLAWHGEIAEQSQAVYAVIDAAGVAHGKGMKSYLIMMAVRLLEMHRVLKPTGSLYLHCDPTANAYLRMLLDAVFGVANFRNEIQWCYRKWSIAATQFTRNHDVLLFYSKSEMSVFNTQFVPTSDGTLKRWKGRKQQAVFDDDGIRQATSTHQQAETPCPDWWQISILNPNAKERVGYPTQKPLALLDRIVKASSNEGDVVLDPFAGCATACVSAESVNRQWIGIDLSPLAATLVKSRLQDEFKMFFELHHRTDVPHRTDLGSLPSYRTHKHQLFGKQEGHCGGCRVTFQFRNFTVDHIIPKSQGGSDHFDNLQLLCGACNSVKGDRPHAHLIATLQERGVIAGPSR